MIFTQSLDTRNVRLPPGKVGFYARFATVIVFELLSRSWRNAVSWLFHEAVLSFYLRIIICECHFSDVVQYEAVGGEMGVTPRRRRS